jgi:hypothetical protein
VATGQPVNQKRGWSTRPPIGRPIVVQHDHVSVVELKLMLHRGVGTQLARQENAGHGLRMATAKERMRVERRKGHGIIRPILFTNVILSAAKNLDAP